MKRGAQVAVHRMDGRMYVLMEKKDWVSQASRGTSRSRSRLGRKRRSSEKVLIDLEFSLGSDFCAGRTVFNEKKII